MVANQSVGQTPKCKGHDLAGLTATPKTFYDQKLEIAEVPAKYTNL